MRVLASKPDGEMDFYLEHKKEAVCEVAARCLAQEVSRELPPSGD